MSGLEAGLLVGAVHGIVLALALYRRQRNRRANRYLAALLGMISLVLLDGALRAGGLYASHPHLIGVTAWVPFVLGPLVFLYVREMTAPDPTRGRAPWQHFVVPGAYVALLITTFLPRSASDKLAIAMHGGSWLVSAAEIGLLVYGLGYAIAALVLLRRHRAHVRERYSNLRGVSLRWLFVLAVLNAVVWSAALAAFVIRVTGAAEASATSVIVPCGSAITLFVIGYFQLGQAELHAGPPVADPPPALPEPAPKAPPAYQRARLAEDDAADVEARIKAAMTEQRLYQQPGLTLAELADAVGVTPHEVSQVLSTRLARNFYTFINDYRIEHVKAGLTSAERPVLDLAFEAGFQSKSTFNSAFRKATGTTPSEFRRRASAQKA